MIRQSGQDVGIVAIGRNEGERLKSCLRSVVDGVRTVVYVDSGSSDGSAEFARSIGCCVVELDRSLPFSAARARNEGFACVLEHNPDVAYVQFLDGDCDLFPGWLEEGVETFRVRPDVGIVLGSVREIHPEETSYNKLCHLEWQQNPGLVRSSGGRFMIRQEIFSAVGGFRADVIAGEDDEFCVRIRRLGWKILLTDSKMARHDAAMKHFSEWWRRARRAGHAYAHVAALHGKSEERYFVQDCRRIWLWALVLPAGGLVLAPFTGGFSLLFVLCGYALQMVRIRRRMVGRGWSSHDALLYAFFTMLGKFPALAGLLAYHWRQWRGHALTIIEYRRSSSAT